MGRERNSAHERPRRDDDQYGYSHAAGRNDYDETEEFVEDEYEERPRRRTLQSPSQRPYARPPRPSRSRSSSSSHRVPPESVRPLEPEEEYYAPVPRRRKRQQQNWPQLLLGCALGAIGMVLIAGGILFFLFRSLQGNNALPPLLPGLDSSKTYSRRDRQTVPLTQVNQIIVCNKSGNVTLKVDQKANTVSVSPNWRVIAASQEDADREFKNIKVDIVPPGTLTHEIGCRTDLTPPAANQGTPESTSTPTPLETATFPPNSLVVNVVFPENVNPNNAVDIDVTLPQAALPSNFSAVVNVEAPKGNIDIDGVSGLLNIKAGINDGNITVKNAVMADGSSLSTPSGTIMFDGLLAAPSIPSKTAYYKLSGKHINVTLPANLNVTVDARTNDGTITSQFPIPKDAFQKDGSEVSYHGPLNPGQGEPSNAQISLHVGIGNIEIKQKLAPGT